MTDSRVTDPQNSADADVIQMPIRTKLVCSACGAVGQGSCRCNAPYVPAGKRAEEAVAANPGKSDRSIADDVGVSRETIRRARKATATNVSVEKRVGKDGKARKQPKPKTPKPPAQPRTGRRGESMPQLDRACVIVRPLIEAKKTFNCHALETEHGISHYTFDAAVAAEKARLKTLAELFDAAAMEHFTDKGALRIDDAIRIHKARLDKNFEQQVREEVLRRIEAANDSMRANNKELRAEIFRLERTIERGKIFTIDEYRAIIRCLHPDSTPSSEIKNKAFLIFEPKKFALTGEK